VLNKQKKGLSQKRFYPHPPKRGLDKRLIHRKSPLGDLGAKNIEGAFETAPFLINSK
jgi:hypothetical protein